MCSPLRVVSPPDTNLSSRDRIGLLSRPVHEVEESDLCVMR
jgi:hypothetical protein